MRRFMGRQFNSLSRVLFSSLSVRDTQCGFKLYPRALGQELFGSLKCMGWAHDVEILLRAQGQGVELVENPVAWHAVEGSQIRPIRDAFGMFREVLAIRSRLRLQGWKRALRSPWNRATVALLLLALAFVLLSYPQRSIIIDEPVQQLYGQFCARWYGTGFDDDRAMSLANLALYGAAFEFWPGAIKEVYPAVDIFPLRKLMTALLGILGVVCAARLAILISGRALCGFLVTLMLLLHPFWVGHHFINSKDGPFAVGYLWCLWYLCHLVRALPYVPPNVTTKLGIALGLTLGVRVGGVLILPVIALGICYPLWRAVQQKKLASRAALWTGARTGLTVGVLAFLVMLAFWPAAQLRPLAQPLEALRAASKFAWNGEVRYMGELVPAMELPSTYSPYLFFLQMPEVLLVGLLGGLLLLPLACRHLARHGGFLMVLLALAGTLPLLVVLITEPVLFDKARHFLFCVGPLAVLSAISWTWVLGLRKPAKVAGGLALAGLLVPPAMASVRLHPYSYTYFNSLAGGQRAGYENFGGDYWFQSGWEALEMLDEHLKSQPSPDRPYRVHCPGFHVQFGYFLETEPVFLRTHTPDKADFVVVSTRIDLDQRFGGETLLAVERYGYPLFKVLDLRGE